MEEEILNTVKALKAGKTILYPTDTIWGIGCDATGSRAVQKIYKLKERVESKSLIVLLDSAEKLPYYVEKIPKIAWDLINSIDTPLTIIYPNAKNLAKNVIAKDKTIAIRITKDEFCRRVIEMFKKPVVSSSANVSGDPSPIMYNKISNRIIEGIDYIVKLYHSRIIDVKPSTIIKLDVNGEFEIIRK